MEDVKSLSTATGWLRSSACSFHDDFLTYFRNCQRNHWGNGHKLVCFPLNKLRDLSGWHPPKKESQNDHEKLTSPIPLFNNNQVLRLFAPDAECGSGRLNRERLRTGFIHAYCLARGCFSEQCASEVKRIRDIVERHVFSSFIADRAYLEEKMPGGEEDKTEMTLSDIVATSFLREVDRVTNILPCELVFLIGSYLRGGKELSFSRPTYRAVNTIRAHDAAIWSITSLPDGPNGQARAASASSDGYVCIWDLSCRSPQVAQRLKHSSFVYSVAPLPNNRVVTGTLQVRSLRVSHFTFFSTSFLGRSLGPML